MSINIIITKSLKNRGKNQSIGRLVNFNDCYKIGGFDLLLLFSAMESDDDNQYQQKEFEMYIPTTRHKHIQQKHKFLKQEFDRINQKCGQIQQQLLANVIKRRVDLIISLIQNCIRQKRSTIIPVCFNVQQKTDLPLFVDTFTKNAYNSFEDVALVKVLEQDEVRDISLAIFMSLRQHKDEKNIVFIVNNIANLNKNNFYLIQKGLVGKNYYLVVPTFQDLDSYINEGSLNYSTEVSHHYLYNSKRLFCDFMMNCLQNQQIMPYLPSETVRLITDFEQYPLQFKEGVRRFVFCIERMKMRSKKQRQYVDFKDLLNKLIDVLVKRSIRPYQQRQLLIERFLKTILDPNYSFSISNNLILNIQHQKSMNENDVIQYLQEKLSIALQANQQWKQYALDIKNYQSKKLSKIPKKKNRNDRLFELAINVEKINVTNKIKLEDCIAYIIRHKTQKIRDQGQQIKWQQIKYEQIIRPMIPYNIRYCKKLKDKKLLFLINLMTNRQRITIQQLLYALISQKIDFEDGQVLYLLATLEILGLIQRNKSASKMTFLCNFFQVAQFNNMQNKR